MHPKEIEKKIEQAATLHMQEHHPESLAIIEDIKTFLPNSPMLFFMRVENLAALGRTNEAVHDCGRLLQRLNQIREAGNSLDDLLDIEQAERLAEFVTEQTDQAGTLKRTLDRRQADALDKETLQSTVADLEAKLNAFLNQREKASQEQKNLVDELNNLREKERNTTEALEKAYTELDTLKHTLVKREAEISEAENELAQREQLVVRLEQEVQSLQERSESAVHAEEMLNEELKRLKQQGDQKSEALEQARRELEELHQSLEEREKAVEEAKAQNLENETALNAMREEMQRIHDEAQKAENAKETLQSELDLLRKNEEEKSEALEAARIQLSAMQDTLMDREKNVAEAENRAKETEQEKAALREQLNEIVKRAENAAASEYALADEVASLRSNEAKKVAELERTRGEMERMRDALKDKEKTLQQHIQKSELSSEAEKSLREELDAIRGRSREFAESEKHLAKELDHLRESEAEKSKTLETARNEMESLRTQLSKQQEAVAEAEEASFRYDTIVSTLQQELHTLQEQVQTASSSEQELAQELTLLRENESSKTQALAEAQAEMEDLRSRLVQRETEAREAEVVNTQKQRELEQLHLELELLRARTDETRDTESTLTQEIAKLRQSETAKNQELAQSREEVEALKQVLTEREEAASRAAQEQESSREIIQKLETELAMLRHKDLEQQSSQQVLQDEVTQIKDAVQRQGSLEDTPQARKLKEIQEQLQTLEESRLDSQQALREQATKLALQQSSQRQTSRDAATLAGETDTSAESQLFALSGIVSNTPQTKTQLQALKLAQQQSQRQTQSQAAQIARQQSQRQTQSQAAQIARQQSQRQTQSQAAQIARQQSQQQTKSQAAQIARQQEPPSFDASPTLDQEEDFQPPIPYAEMEALPTGRNGANAGEEDDFETDFQESYPKPRDVAFVFPDQSCSIAVKRNRSSYRIYIAAGLLFFIALIGIAAFVLQGVLSKPSGDGNETDKTTKNDEVKMLRLEFPTDRPFGTLYDHNTHAASDSEWQPYAEAKGIVEYPETAKLHLVVRRDHADDLSPLAKLPPRCLSSLWLPEFDMSEQNIRYLQSLERVGVIYIDQEMTEREKQLIAAGFKGDTGITSKMPGVVIREMTPPDKRELSFPEDKAVGLLAIRTWNDPNFPWQYLDIARGKVEIPARMEIQLKVSAGTTDLSFLKEFDETTFHTLILEGQTITDVFMQDVVHLRGLLALELIDTAVDKAGMEMLSVVSGLQQIKIENTKMDDDAIDVFRDLPQLSIIEIIKAPNITYKSLHLFRNLRALRRLNIQDTGITLEQIRELGRDLPACAVTPM